MNLIGEHTDYNAGLVLPVALPHATYAAARARADELVRVASRQQEDVWEGTLAELGPGSVDGWAGYAAGVVWALREAGYDVPGVDLLVDSRVPVGAGLSSSAALECSVGTALLDLVGAELTDDVRDRLVDAAIRAETEVVGAPTGGMDQTVAVHATRGRRAAHRLRLRTSDTVVPLDLADHTLLVTDTRVSHSLTDGGYGSRRADCESAARALGVPTLRAATLDVVEALPDDRVRRRAPARGHRDPAGHRHRRRAGRRDGGTRSAGSSTPRTARCATTSRSPAPSSTAPWRSRSRQGRSRPG